MKALIKTITAVALGLLVVTTPVQAGEHTVTHFGNEFTLEEWLTVGPGRHYQNERGREHSIRGFEQAWERQQRVGNRNNDTATQPAVTTPVAPQPAPSVPVQPVAPTAPVVNASIPEGVAVSNLSNRPEEFANHQMLETELEVLRLVNEIRAEHGLEPLILDLALSVAARNHSEDMAINGFRGHVGSNGSRVIDRTRLVGIDRAASENVAGTVVGTRSVYESASQVVDMWMNSEGHRRNILDGTSRYIGIGSADFQNERHTSRIWIQKFI